MHIDKNSYGTVFGVLGACAVIVALVLLLVRPFWVAWTITFVAVWFALFVTCFFRVPKRHKKGDDRHITAVADGVTVIIEKAFEKEFLKRDCLQISTYMNFFDMHANFWPVSGEVTYYKYHPGKHLLAFKPKSSEENEHTCTCIRTPDGQEVFFKQIAGGFARRIVNYAKPGMQVTAGEQCGIIKFGSRIDIFIPLDADVKVKMREVTRACESVIAELR